MIEDWLAASIAKLVKPDSYFFRLVKEGKVSLTPTHVIDLVYKDLRVCSYPSSERNEANIGDVTARVVPGTEVWEQGVWHFRVPSNRRDMGWSTRDSSTDRVSLNVYGEPELIEKLDGFCSRHKAYYKTPGQIAAWEGRHDPITVYFHEAVSPAIASELKEIVTPHVRGDNLYGDKIAEGICRETTPSVEQVHALIARAEQLDPALGAHVRKAAGEDPLKPKLSAGQKRAIEIVLDDYEQYAARTPAPVISKPLPDSLKFLARCDADISTYNTTKGKMLCMTIRGTPEQLANMMKRLQESGLDLGTVSKTDHQIVMRAPEAQQIIAGACHAQGVDPFALTKNPAV